MTKQDYILTQPITKAALLTLCNRGVEEAQNLVEREYEEATSRYFAANTCSGSTRYKLTVPCEILNLYTVYRATNHKLTIELPPVSEIFWHSFIFLFVLLIFYSYII